jgi:hypothetical protein
MRKTAFLGLLVITLLSCKKNQETEISIEKPEIIENITENEDVNIEKLIDSLKNGNYSKELGKYSNKVLYEIAENMIFEDFFLSENPDKPIKRIKEIEDIKNDFIKLYRDSGTGASVKTQTLHVIDNNVIDLGDGFDKLSEKNHEKLDKEIKKLQKNYMHISGRSGSTIELLKNGNYLVSFRGLIEDDAEASGGSLEISYETKDIKSFIPETLKVKSGI